MKVNKLRLQSLSHISQLLDVLLRPFHFFATTSLGKRKAKKILKSRTGNGRCLSYFFRKYIDLLASFHTSQTFFM